MGFTLVKNTGANSIPVIDITPLRDGSNAIKVANALHKASQTYGFIYIVGHGIPTTTIEMARASAMEFFRHSDNQKSTVTISPKHRGWLGQGGSKMSDHANPDIKESFLWGYQDECGHTPLDHPLRGPNQWPGFLPLLEQHAMDFFHHAHKVAHHLMRGFALGLGLEENFFLQSCSRPLSRASFVYYPGRSEQLGESQFGVSPHTDFGVLTVLSQDDVGGLQVKDINGQWIEAPPIEGSLVVNVADLLARWTDNAYRSTPHRVINSSGRERLSLVLAFDPDPETIIDARQIYGNDYPVENDPISCGDYLIWRFNKAFSYRKS